jgi:hypothetical protein
MDIYYHDSGQWLFLVPVADDVARSRALAGPVPSCDGDRETVVQGNMERPGNGGRTR